jgi:hypothetical protein
MKIWQRELIGLLVVAAGCLPLFEVLYKGSYRRRGGQVRTTRQEDPAGYWMVVALTALTALAALMAGAGIALGALQP